MGKWAVTLTSGKALREAIDEENIIQCFECLKSCYQELHNKLPETFTDEDLDMALVDIDYQLEDLQDLDDPDMYEDAAEEFDYLLDDFYDLCDALNVWVGM